MLKTYLFVLSKNKGKQIEDISSVNRKNISKTSSVI